MTKSKNTTTAVNKFTHLRKKKGKGPQGPKGPWKWTPERLDELADELIEWADPKSSLMLSKFCADKGLHPSQISELSKQNKNFCEAIKKVKAKEAYFLEQCCLFESLTSPDGRNRKVSTTGAIFLLKNNHKYTDGREANKPNLETGQILQYVTTNFAKATSTTANDDNNDN